MMHHFSTRQKIIVMLAVMSGLFLVALDQTIIATALASIVEEFKSFSSLGFVVTAYMLTTTITVPLAGKLSDMFGRRPMLITGVTVFTLGSLLSGLSPSIEWLIAWRALQGIGGGIITANALLANPKSGREVTRVAIVHDLGTAAGHADLDVPGLLFDDTLQPDMLTGLALGVVANTKGTVTGRGRIDWTESGVTSSGRSPRSIAS